MNKAAALLLLVTAVAHADDVVKRELPDYDGRGDAPTTAGDVAIWVPRVAMAPLYLVSEYGVRRPMGWLVKTAERDRWVPRLVDFFTTDDRKAGWVPSFFFERGFHPTAGLYLFADDLGATGNDLRLSGSLGPGHRALTVTDRFTRGGMRLTLRAAGSKRDDYATYGEGAETREEDGAHYGSTRYEASATVEGRAGPLRARAGLGYRDVSFFASSYGGNPVDMLEDDYRGLVERLGVDLDLRRAATGVRIGAELEHGPSWTRLTGTTGASAGLGRGRVASLSLTAAVVEGDDVPVTELATVGGTGPLVGFSAGRLAGRSALSAVAQYEWPVAVWLNGTLYAGAGNVFGEHFEDATPGLLRLTGGLGLRTAGSPDHRLEMLVAFGTEPIRDGTRIEAVRIVFGGTHAF